MTNAYVFPENYETRPNLTSANGEQPNCVQVKCSMITDPEYRPMVANSLRARIETISLDRGEVIRLEKNSGVRNIKTKNGVVWLTGTPASGDMLLQNGEQFELRNHWPYIIEALEEAELLLVSNL